MQRTNFLTVMNKVWLSDAHKFSAMAEAWTRLRGNIITSQPTQPWAVYVSCKVASRGQDSFSRVKYLFLVCLILDLETLCRAWWPLCIDYNTTNIQMFEASDSYSCMLLSSVGFFPHDFLSFLLILSRLKHTIHFLDGFIEKLSPLESFPSLTPPPFLFNLSPFLTTPAARGSPCLWCICQRCCPDVPVCQITLFSLWPIGPACHQNTRRVMWEPTVSSLLFIWAPV